MKLFTIVWKVLYMVTNNDKGIAGYQALYSQIDLKTGAITNITGIDKKILKAAMSFTLTPRYGFTISWR